MLWEDYYKILQVHYMAEQEVIEVSYKRLSKKYHPDLMPGRYSEERMKKLNCAYETLGNKEKRSTYHEQWIKRQSSINRNSQDMHTYDEAFFVLNEYFQHLLSARYVKAYSRLSAINKKNISQDEFIKWQEAVSSVFTLGSYILNYFKEHEPFTVSEIQYKKAKEYGVDVTDKCLKTGRVSKESITKYVVFENDAWFVYLGHENLKTLTYKFQCLAKAKRPTNHEAVFNQMLLKVDALTGLLSREGFYEKARDEKERSNRYGSKFSVVVLEVVFKKNMNIASREEEFNLAMAQASGIIHSSIRTTDILGRWGKNKFIILLSETDEKSACLAIKKLHISLKKHGVFYASVHAGVAQYLNGDLLTIIKEAEFRYSFSKIRSGKESHLKIVSSIGYNRNSNLLKRYHMASAHKSL